MSGTFDLFDGHCDGQNGLHTHFAHHYGGGDRVAWGELAFKGFIWVYVEV